MELLAVLAIILVIATPILAISAFVRVQRLTEHLRIFPLAKLTDRIATLERHLAAIEKAVASGEARAPAPPKPSAPAPPTVVPHMPAVAPPSVPSSAPSPLSVPEIPRPREVSPHRPEISVFAAPPLHASQTKSSSTLDWETIIGGRWLNRIGIVALIGATTFFLKYAFDNNWIGPRGRVAIGILLGASMLPWSQ